jgi:hypothetical protein
MKKPPSFVFYAVTLLLSIVVPIARPATAQVHSFDRTFPNPLSEVQRVVDGLRSSSSGRLPILDGFVDVGDQPLTDYQRGYYACTLRVLPAPSGGTLVQATAKITAWYVDPKSAKPGYRELISNGRVETDLLDQIEQSLGGNAAGNSATSRGRAPAATSLTPRTAQEPPAPLGATNTTTRQPEHKIEPSASSESSPIRNSPGVAVPTTPADRSNVTVPVDPAPGESLESIRLRRDEAERQAQQVSADIKSLEEIQQNQARPTDLVVVKKAHVAIFSKPEDGAQVLLSTDQEDEFQILGLEGSWVHVQISGASRGWMRRSQVELPAGYSSGGSKASDALPASANLFKVAREETNTFSGNWEPLQGKSVHVIWIETASASGTSAAEKRKFAKGLLLKAYNDMTSSNQRVEGIVIVFDSADGGQIAATMESLKALQDGSLSEPAFWRRCSLDPPEAFHDSAKS